MSAGICPTCGLPVADPEDLGRVPGVRYQHTQGGHNDRHALVLEAARRAVIA